MFYDRCYDIVVPSSDLDSVTILWTDTIDPVVRQSIRATIGANPYTKS